MPKGYSPPLPANKEAEIVNRDRFAIDKVPDDIDYIIVGSGMSGL
jgi:hypothetical protein